MILIVGHGIIPEMETFVDVRNALKFDYDVYLGAFACKFFGELEGKVIYNMEYLHDDAYVFVIGYMETLKNNIVIDFSRSNVEYLKAHGIDVFYMPYGYHKTLERVTPKEKDIDVLFIGTTHHERRARILDKLAKNCMLVVATNCYGTKLDDVVARAKVHLNMHHLDGQPLETVRLNYLMANHCNIVSERGSDEMLNRDYAEGVRFCDYDELIDTCMLAMEKPIDGYDAIKQIPQDCRLANKWIRERLCQQQQ